MGKEQSITPDQTAVARYLDFEQKSYEADTRGTAPNRKQIKDQLRMEAIEVRLYYPATDQEKEVSVSFFDFLDKNKLPLREGIVKYFNLFTPTPD